MKRKIVYGLLIFTLLGCDNPPKASQESPATEITIYHGGDILTMEGEQPVYAEAVAVQNGKIVFVGSLKDAGHEYSNAQRINLAGKTLLPGFIDPHSHFINALSMSNQANCSPPPVGKAGDVEGIINSLKDFSKEKGLKDGELLMGYGYDDNAMPEGELLNRDHLDRAFPNNPVLIIHVSLHGAVLNSLALQQYGISAETESPPGGIIVRKPGTKEPYGLIMETAFLPIFSQLPKPSPEELKQQLREGQMIYAEAGVTTAQEGASHIADVVILQDASHSGQLFIDVVSYPFITEFDTIFKIYSPSDFGKYNSHFKLGGIKITIDGSPQGKTALFTTPYLTGGPDGQENWLGEPSFSQEEVNQMLKGVYEKGVQSTFHANGDGAIDMCLKAHEYAAEKDLSADRRTIIIHSQFVRKDQLEKYVEYNLIPSLYTEHTFFFADAHIKNRGLEQASFISPIKTAMGMGLRPTNHTDFNVAPIDQLLVVWTAVNRISRNGETIGADEKITPYQALQAITTNAAYQYFEENDKGSLKEGKLADFVVLDKNPLKVDPMTIKDIQVLETIKEGETVFKKS